MKKLTAFSLIFTNGWRSYPTESVFGRIPVGAQNGAILRAFWYP
jgi:hypothetical protein